MKKLILYFFVLIISVSCHQVSYHSFHKPSSRYPNFIFVQGGPWHTKQGNQRSDLICSDFFISQFEITNAQYVYFLNHLRDSTWFTPDYIPELVTLDTIIYQNSKGKFIVRKQYKNHPVTNIDYYAATYYGTWLRQEYPLYTPQKDGKENYQISFRLPIEIEWYYAASERGKTDSIQWHTFSGSDNADDVAWYKNNCSSLQPSGSKKPNALDLYDMSGNAYEWCEDNSFPVIFNPGINPLYFFEETDRIIRGGSYQSDTSKINVLNRDNCWPDSTRSDLGFRVAQSSLYQTTPKEYYRKMSKLHKNFRP